jgi:two-component sensor histidine kinase
MTHLVHHTVKNNLQIFGFLQLKSLGRAKNSTYVNVPREYMIFTLSGL